MKTTTLFLTAILIAFTACSQSENAPNDISSQETVQEQDSQQSVKRVTKAEFNTFMADHSDYILVDVRTPEEFNNGTIENAVNINFNDPNFQAQLNELDKAKPVLMFCHSGGRSGRALPIFKTLGFQHVLELEGGYSQY